MSGNHGCTSRTAHWLSALALAALLGACGLQPYDPPDHRENPEGPGLLSGEAGEFVIYRK